MMAGLLPGPGSLPRKPSRALFLIAAAIGPLILIALTFWVDARFRDVDVVRSVVRASSEQRAITADLVLALTQAESAQRAYVVTGGPGFLARYRTAIESTASDLSQLSSKRFDTVRNAPCSVRLRQMVVAKAREMAAVNALRQHEGVAAASARIASGRGVELMEAVRSAAVDLVGAQQIQLHARQRFLDDRFADFLDFMWGLTLLAAALLFAGSVMLWQARLRRYRIERDAYETATLLQEAFSGNADATLLLDAHGVIQAANAAAMRLFGYNRDEFTGLDLLDLLNNVGDGDFQTRVGLVGGQLAKPYWLDRVMRHRDGHDVAVDIALGPMQLPDATYVIATIRDIGERKTIERLKDEFLATVSHELRTPLTSVIGALGLLRGGASGAYPDGAQRLIEIAENNSRRLIRLINDLLDIDKIGSAQMRFERAPFDLAGTARAAIEAARGLAEDRAIRIELVAGPRPLIVDGDHDRLMQVLANLLSNAIRVSPDRGLVRVSLMHQRGQVVATVDDEGPGVSSDFSARIFERFAQASDTTPGGSGLGLAISREIIVAHEGRIWFGRAPNGGARFCFSLPPVRELQPLRGSRPCILIGEADDAASGSLRDILEADDCGVECVATGREALEAARSGKYDAIVLDADLRDADGLDTARVLQGCHDTRKLPVIIVAPKERSLPSDMGADASEMIDWIVKPVDPARLIEAVRRAITRSAAIRPTLLHIDGDPDMLEIAAGVLAGHGRILHATSVASARAVLAAQSPDIVILDLNLPDGSGSDLIPDLRQPDGSAIPTVIYSAGDVPPELEDQVDAVLIKSRRSLSSLARAIHRILATVDDDMTPA